jgi:hypothetical protein
MRKFVLKMKKKYNSISDTLVKIKKDIFKNLLENILVNF